MGLVVAIAAVLGAVILFAGLVLATRSITTIGASEGYGAFLQRAFGMISHATVATVKSLDRSHRVVMAPVPADEAPTARNAIVGIWMILFGGLVFVISVLIAIVLAVILAMF
ncbi:hypothetical protein [Galbitalea soli]|uniref:DUF3899 domain-containing protein n=1 Tax=Galbitalea soli TaxID=1268042 RepID=A0A7C9PNU5_9MICO|nr:hypothetical protein [Galbitalea soli]NEM91691.1 hypothetical protein [Galbitalea soli]NYJ30387.1 ABC-type antimicrobial peptide transport system permease subunit [Galbitalea soli]